MRVLRGKISCLGCRKEARYYEPAQIRIMSYNIAAGHGSIAAIVEIIREYDPDIIALQEVDVNWSIRSGYDDPAASAGLYPHQSVSRSFCNPADGFSSLMCILIPNFYLELMTAGTPNNAATTSAAPK